MLAQLVPDDADPSGDVHGGVVMKLVDTAAGLAAMQHARSRVVTVAMDSMTFEAPVHIGDLVHLNARLTWTGRTSMEIEVVVEAENILAGIRRRTSTAYLSMWRWTRTATASSAASDAGDKRRSPEVGGGGAAASGAAGSPASDHMSSSWS